VRRKKVKKRGKRDDIPTWPDQMTKNIQNVAVAGVYLYPSTICSPTIYPLTNHYRSTATLAQPSCTPSPLPGSSGSPSSLDSKPIARLELVSLRQPQLPSKSQSIITEVTKAVIIASAPPSLVFKLSKSIMTLSTI
jgi:hypothetical protein